MLLQYCIQDILFHNTRLGIQQNDFYRKYILSMHKDYFTVKIKNVYLYKSLLTKYEFLLNVWTAQIILEWLSTLYNPKIKLPVIRIWHNSGYSFNKIPRYLVWNLLTCIKWKTKWKLIIIITVLPTGIPYKELSMELIAGQWTPLCLRNKNAKVYFRYTLLC